MGGHAFDTSGPNGTPLAVPRMPFDVYSKVASEIQKRLQPIFRNITIPREAPGKADFGDIDFLVEGALLPWTPSSIKEAIGATHMVDCGGAKSYAIPYSSVLEVDSEQQDSEEQVKYAQVDVEICPGEGTPDSTEFFEWAKFLKSDSDLLQIVGICHRGLGITCNDRGLHVCVKEIEPYHYKKSLLLLTRNVDAAISFYGMDIQTYRQGFKNEEELFEWVSQGRFLRNRVYEEREEKHSDRVRLKKRPMYTRFMKNFMSKSVSDGVVTVEQDQEEVTEPWTREKVLEEALRTFNKQPEYDAMIAEHNLLERDTAVWKCIRERLPIESKTSLAMALKGLRRWVNFTEDGKPFVTEAAILEGNPVWGVRVTEESKEEVMAWVDEHWSQVKALEKALSKKRLKEGRGDSPQQVTAKKSRKGSVQADTQVATQVNPLVLDPTVGNAEPQIIDKIDPQGSRTVAAHAA